MKILLLFAAKKITPTYGGIFCHSGDTIYIFLLAADMKWLLAISCKLLAVSSQLLVLRSYVLE
jgi:hypothetical protein